MNLLKTIRIFITVFSVVIFSNIAFAEVFKCTDESGAVKYQEIECNENEESKKIKMQKPRESDSSKNAGLGDFYKETQASKSQVYNSRKKIVVKKKKPPNPQCKQLRSQLKSQKEILYKRCKKGHNTYCNKSALVIDRSLNKFYTTDIYGNDTNKYTHFKIKGQAYKGVETPL